MQPSSANAGPGERTRKPHNEPKASTPLTDGLERRNHRSKLGFSPRWISSDQPSNAGVDAILCILILMTTKKKKQQQKKTLRRMLPKEHRELFSLHRGHNYRNRNLKISYTRVMNRSVGKAMPVQPRHGRIAL
uniref:Uncharacterized protein n=1 Tax=Anopheles merus TaxID=30066 RepID=A0A182V2L2_ANOME